MREDVIASRYKRALNILSSVSPTPKSTQPLKLYLQKMRFSSVFVLASLVASSFASTVADIQADIADISTKLTTLDNSIAAFPSTGGTLSQALAIHSNAVTLGKSIDQGTTDVNDVDPKPFSDEDGRAILDSFTALEPTINNALIGIVDKKAALEALPVGGIPALVKQDLSNLSASTAALEDALIAAAPESIVDEAIALKERIDAAFATAIAAYA
ncbi:hypothetical protein D9615_004803 [Tricholomella constricta]|uniref:Hydrophobic surface binding protein n=1 Tax=Tricholomella constricta TaxID=117010 RepID=A0A8H5M6Q6_9AGAR|nr:hypothetical protein D9615_004803 [Tricholomella constricta]